MALENCFFNWKYNCGDKNEQLIESGHKRIETIIRCSKVYHDNIHQQLQDRLDENTDFTIKCHKSCVSSYTTLRSVNTYLKRHNRDPVASLPPKQTRRSTVSIFNFQQHCIFCGEVCDLDKDPKNPSRWRPAYLCREVNLKQAILEVCDDRNDEWAASVRVRVQGALSDLHAADAKYHVDCKSKFMSRRSVLSASKSGNDNKELDSALDSLILHIQEDLSRIWNSVELFKAYSDYGGDKLSRKLLVQQLSEHFADDLLVLSAPGVASIIAFRSKASSVLRLVDEEEDDLDVAVDKVSKRIKQEIKCLPVDHGHYSTQIDCETAKESVSDTLAELLGKLSPKLDGTLPAILVGCIITSVLQNYPTSLQTSLGVLIRDSKKLIHQMHKFGVTCSYDEVLRFKKSAALATVENTDLSGISNADLGLIQVVADNFDADISSQNGKLSTHSLAVLVTQTCSVEDHQNGDQRQIKRIKKTEMSNPIDYEIPIERYNGPKIPELPKEAMSTSVMPLKLVVQKFIEKRRAEELDFAFMQDVITKPLCPEFNGYNTRNSREQGHMLKPKTNAVYLPLIDMTPSDPDTMMTALAQAQHLSLDKGQEFVVFTSDLQLYRVALHVIWTYPDRFANVIMRLGGMHALMSFAGSIGTLMAESGLSDVLSTVFGGVPKMLTGKKFPQNVRALRILAEELLRGIIEKTPLAGKADLMKVLDDLAVKSKTAKLWIDVLIKPVFIMMMFIRAEREADWLLHLEAFRLMVPYFFAAGHVHYARYGSFYLRSMESLSPNVREKFMRGEHVMRHVPGLWNGIWSDMFIETTFMRYGHGQGGIIGITLKPETLKTWALSLHISSQLESDLTDMIDSDDRCAQNSHKEEGKARVNNDVQDRKGIQSKLEMCIDPLDPAKHPDDIVNIVSGSIGPPLVNVHDAVKIGTQQMQQFESTLPKGFNETIQKKVETMTSMKKHVKVGDVKVFDTNLIYSRVIGLQASSREVNINDVLSHELSPVPTAMFTDSGDMRISKAKSILKKQLQVEVSARTAVQSEVTIIDGSALLWVVHWPAGGRVKDYVINLRGHIERKLETTDVYLIFDRYHEYSTKSVTRGARAAGASRVHQLSANTQLPPQNIVLTVTENKKQLMHIICTELVQDQAFHQKHLQKHKLVITGHERTPVEISNGGIVIYRKDMDTGQEEADTIIVQQMLMIANEKPISGISVLSNDTDVFVLLLHFYLLEGLKLCVKMESPIKERAVIDIGETVDKHRDIIPEILSAHALSGCDTVSCCFGIGKGTALKVVRSGCSLLLLGKIDAPMPAVLSQATRFMAACYGQSKCDSMSKARVNVWAAKTGKGYTSTPKLCSLPPTTEAFEENVKRAHHQAILWRSLKEADQPELDPEKYGWRKDVSNKSLIPVTVPQNVALAPDSILRLIRCGCESLTPCRTSRCGCSNAKLSCTLFCACHCVNCSNTHTQAV